MLDRQKCSIFISWGLKAETLAA